LVLTTLALHSTSAQGSNEQAARAAIAKAGVGQNAKVEITLRDKGKVKGYVAGSTADSFTVADKKSGATQIISYADVQNVKGPHKGMKTSSWIIIAAAAAAAVIVGVTVVKPVVCDGGAGC
jgi:hypothetical protein